MQTQKTKENIDCLVEVYDRYVNVYKHGELLSQISCSGTV